MRKLIVLVIVLLIEGCSGLPFAPTPDGELEKRQAIELLNYQAHFASMTAKQQHDEYLAASQQLARKIEPANRVRLALIIATIDSDERDTERAARLIEPMVRNTAETGPLYSLARMLYTLLIAHANERAHSSRLREQLESKSTIEHKLREQLAASKEAERTMREQLEALKEVERTIMQRKLESQPRRK